MLNLILPHLFCVICCFDAIKTNNTKEKRDETIYCPTDYSVRFPPDIL